MKTNGFASKKFWLSTLAALFLPGGLTSLLAFKPDKEIGEIEATAKLPQRETQA